MLHSLFRVLAGSCLLFAACSPSNEKATGHDEVRALLDAQAKAWNRHDLDGFLAGLPYESLVPAIQKTNTTIDVPVADLGLSEKVPTW